MQEQISNLNELTIPSKIEILVKSPKTKKRPRDRWIQCRILPGFQKGINNAKTPQIILQNIN